MIEIEYDLPVSMEGRTLSVKRILLGWYGCAAILAGLSMWLGDTAAAKGWEAFGCNEVQCLAIGRALMVLWVILVHVLILRLTRELVKIQVLVVADTPWTDVMPFLVALNVASLVTFGSLPLMRLLWLYAGVDSLPLIRVIVIAMVAASAYLSYRIWQLPNRQNYELGFH